MTILRRIGAAVAVAAVVLLHAAAQAAGPLETVRAFQQACAAKEVAAAMKMIAGAPGAGETEDAYFQQKARRLVEVTGTPERRAEAVAEKSDGDLAVTVVVSTGPGERREIEPLYLKRAGDTWQIIPFTNWRKLPVTAAEKKSLEALEKWYDGEEERRSGSAAGAGAVDGG